MTDYAALVARLRAHISKAGHDAEQCANDGLDLAGDAADAIEQLTRTVAEMRARLDVTSEEYGCVPVSFAYLCDSIDSKSLAAEVENLVLWHIRRADAATARLRTVEAETWEKAAEMICRNRADGSVLYHQVEEMRRRAKAAREGTS